MARYAGIPGLKYKIVVPGNIPPAWVKLGGETVRINAGCTVTRELFGGDFAELEEKIKGVRIAPASLRIPSVVKRVLEVHGVDEPVASESVRAHNVDGTFVADDPETPENEAWVDEPVEELVDEPVADEPPKKAKKQKKEKKTKGKG
jgi:hypothetical protein